jgi:hypothetical protein
LSPQLRELRKWDLAPLGGVLVVVVLAALVILALAAGRGPGRPALVRSYFASEAGGGAPREQADLMQVDACQPTGEFVEEVVFVCTVTFRKRIYHPCFAFAGDRVVFGSRELADQLSTCERVVWSRSLANLIVPAAAISEVDTNNGVVGLSVDRDALLSFL